jgi:hypothetical protein
MFSLKKCGPLLLLIRCTALHLYISIAAAQTEGYNYTVPTCTVIEENETLDGQIQLSVGSNWWNLMNMEYLPGPTKIPGIFFNICRRQSYRTFMVKYGKQVLCEFHIRHSK